MFTGTEATLLAAAIARLELAEQLLNEVPAAAQVQLSLALEELKELTS